MGNYELASSNVQASRLVGRVGTLAVALGVGAVWFSGGIASADSSSESSTSSPSSHSAGAGNNSAGPRAAHQGRTARSTVAARKSRPAAASSKRAAAAVVPAAAVDATPTVGSAAAVQNATATAPAASTPVVEASAPVVQDTAPVVTTAALPEVAPASGEVSAFAAASAVAADSSANGNPAGSADAPLSWLAAAFSRRAGASAAAAAPGPAAAFQPGICTQASTACAFIPGASGVPIPSFAQAQTAMQYYIQPNSPGETFTPQIVFTPEGAYPITGIKVLPLDISVQQGLTIVNSTIDNLLAVNPNIPISYFGYSQSAIIGSLFQRQQQDIVGSPIAPGQIQYVTVGQEMNPAGGWFARFPGLVFNSTGINFYGATPSNNTPQTEGAYPTSNYALEYDGFADFPKYPMNAISVLNAVMGIFTTHVSYLTPNYFKNTYGATSPLYLEGPGTVCATGGDGCTQLPVTPDAADQKYYFIDTPFLPMLAPLRLVPLIGKPLAALVEPVLRVIVDLGYSDAAHGFTTAGQPLANVIDPFAFLPPITGPFVKEVIGQLVAGVKQGIHDFFGSFGANGSVHQDIAAMVQRITDRQANPYQATGVLDGIGNLITKVTATISTALSASYATLLATADFLNAALLPLQAYNTNIVFDSIKQIFKGEPIQGLMNMIGLPLAADVGMVTTVGVFQVVVWLEALIAAATGCGPAAPYYNPSCPA